MKTERRQIARVMASNGLSYQDMIYNRNNKQVKKVEADGTRVRFSFFKDNLAGVRLCGRFRKSGKNLKD